VRSGAVYIHTCYKGDVIVLALEESNLAQKSTMAPAAPFRIAYLGHQRLADKVFFMCSAQAPELSRFYSLLRLNAIWGNQCYWLGVQGEEEEVKGRQ